MTAWKRRQSVLLLVILLGTGCTDRRPPKAVHINVPPMAPEILEPVADVRFEDQVTETQQMVIKGGSLFLTGKPFAFARWNIASDPENPRMTFAASDQMDTFSPHPKFGSWTPDWYASGALAILGNVAIMSGTAGVSVVSIAETHSPVEVQRYPPREEDSIETVRDEAFVYTSLAAHPQIPMVYGFREQDFMYKVGVQGANLTLQEKFSYGPDGVCCATGSAVFSDMLFVAMTSRLWMYDFGPNGALVAPAESTKLQAVNVVASDRYLYVQHQPTFSNTESTLAQGIYVLDPDGNAVAHLGISPIRFAVYQDTYLYANVDNASVRIFKIKWTNQ